MNKINLYDLWYLDAKDYFIYTDNIIYQCKNLINGKSYIGQTGYSLYDRWCVGKFSHLYDYTQYPDHHRILYRAIRKYQPYNFEVIILQSGFSSKEDRLLAEISYIKSLHTYKDDPEGPGYNMTIGGDDVAHLHTPDAIQKRMDNNRSNHDGVLAWNLPDVIQRRLERARKKYDGDAMGHLHTKEIYDKLRADNGGVLPIHTESAISKRLATNTERYGDPMGQCHTPSAIAVRIENDKAAHGGRMGVHSPENLEKAHKASRLAFLLNSIDKHITSLVQAGYDVNVYTYRYKTYDANIMNHLARIYAAKDILMDHPGTPESIKLILNQIHFNEKGRIRINDDIDLNDYRKAVEESTC